MANDAKKDSKNIPKVGPLLNFGYFKCSQLAIDFLLSQKNIGKAWVSRDVIIQHSEYVPPFTLESGSIFLAARYNFRHALELSMKALFQSAGKEVPAGHDLGGLCKKMEEELLGYSIIKNSFEAWKWLVGEYSTRDEFVPEDRVNELDRYMFDNKGITKFPYSEIHKKTRKDLIRFKRDIKTAKQLFWKISAEKWLVEYCKKFMLDPEKNNKSKTVICKLRNGRFITRRRVGVHSDKMIDG